MSSLFNRGNYITGTQILSFSNNSDNINSTSSMVLSGMYGDGSRCGQDNDYENYYYQQYINQRILSLSNYSIENNSSINVPTLVGNNVFLQKDKEKRRLPCRTYISVGCCPYRDRCAYLHDPRIASQVSKSKSRKKSAEESGVHDAFFWPPMEDQNLKIDNTGLPIVIQSYSIQQSNQQFGAKRTANCDVEYSMWNHFVDYISRTNTGGSFENYAKLMSISDLNTIDGSDSECNVYTNSSRLPVLRLLSQGNCIVRQPKDIRTCSPYCDSPFSVAGTPPIIQSPRV